MKISLGTDCSGIESVYMALQLMKHDIDYKFASEIDTNCQETMSANFPHPEVFYEDLKKREKKTLPKKLDLYVCGFPCQSYSTAGLRMGKADPRGAILNHVLNTIDYIKPKIFILENVKNFKNIQDGKVFKTTMKRLRKNGLYHVYSDVLNAKNYGVAQNRERLFIIGIRTDILKSGKSYTTPLKKQMAPIENYIDQSVQKGKHVPPSIKRVYNTHKNKINPKKMVILSTGGFGTASNISPTITHSHKHFVYQEKRYLTAREALRLQGFPKSFKKVVSETELYKQAGNSMSIHCLKALFKQVFKIVKL